MLRNPPPRCRQDASAPYNPYSTYETPAQPRGCRLAHNSMTTPCQCPGASVRQLSYASKTYSMEAFHDFKVPWTFTKKQNVRETVPVVEYHNNCSVVRIRNVRTRRFTPRADSAAGHVRSKCDESDSEVHEFRCKLTTCKCEEPHAPGYQPGRRIIVRTASKEGRRESAVSVVSD